jgi:cysteinyl-tRNA synthetase
MLDIIKELYDKNIAYIADDGVYFSIDAYKKSGKTYGQLVHIDDASTASERIRNDEYDKESAHDFALWKIARPGEPSWAFELDGKNLNGRPGWHIECSAMSRKLLGAQFDIHTGGIDLKFPHHENEIAQSTAGRDNTVMARFFVHNEHVLVNGTKMSKSLGNFYTLRNVEEEGYGPMSFRMLVLQGHYRNQVHFSWDNLEAAQNRLQNWKEFAALRWQLNGSNTYTDFAQKLTDALAEDLNTPKVMAVVDELISSVTSQLDADPHALLGIIDLVDRSLGLRISSSTPDITGHAKELLAERSKAREQKDYARSDAIRDDLELKGITLRDLPDGRQLWSYSRA